MTIEINTFQFTLLHRKALYKIDEQLLIIADVHLGKANHFRKEGISIPAHTQMGDFENLACLFNEVKPLKVYFLGDLFHSSFNRDWQYFCELIGKFKKVKFTLIKGNHDLIDETKFKEICIEVVDIIEDDFFVYSHDAIDTPANKVNIVGHIHPGIVLSGMGRQSIKLPCFYVTDSLVVLPAFGMLTGLYSIEKGKQSQVYAVVPEGVRKL